MIRHEQETTTNQTSTGLNNQNSNQTNILGNPVPVEAPSVEAGTASTVTNLSMGRRPNGETLMSASPGAGSFGLFQGNQNTIPTQQNNVLPGIGHRMR